MLRAFTLGLVLGRNPNPDAHSFFQGTIFLHSTTSYQKHRAGARKKCSHFAYTCYGFFMSRPTTMCENDLAVLAKTFRRQASTTRAQAARDMKVSQTSIFNAEETPDESLIKLRMRMIETYSKFKVRGPVYLLEDK
jgi:DNA-binding XRE family transcriptional regulator